MSFFSHLPGSFSSLIGGLECNYLWIVVSTWLSWVYIFSSIDLGFFERVSGKNLCNCTNSLNSRFVLVSPWFFSGKGVFHINPSVVIVLFFLDYFSILDDIFLLRLILGLT